MSKFWRFAIISPILGILSFMLVFYVNGREIPGLGQFFVGEYLPSAAFGLLAGISAMLVGKYLNSIIKWGQHHALRFVVQSTILYVIGIGVLILYIELFEIGGKPDYTYKQFWLANSEGVYKIMIILFFVVFVYSLFDFLIHSYNQMREEEIRSVELMNNQLNLQFEALKSQLNPHFLFNSLNTISSLLYSDIDKAEKFIRMFAESYRFIFRQNDKPLIPLQKELDFVQAYNYLLEVRFQASYELKINLPESTLQSYVPPLSIQMLVENAIKHNLISPNTPLSVEIVSHNNYLCVKNNINPLREQPESFKIGIDNIKKRYSYFTNENILLDKDEHFKVSLPLIPTMSSN